MHPEPPFNPLDKHNLGESVAEAMLARPVGPLPPDDTFEGAGIYAIYYAGDYSGYAPISRREHEVPIYVGKAVPAGARKGGFGLGLSPGAVLHKRLVEHAESIRQVKNIRIEDFSCRYLVVDDIWIPLAESLLIEMFHPLWNKVVDGFGNHDPGKGRSNQKRSRWDVIHPGRPWADKLQPNPRSEAEILDEVARFLAGRYDETSLTSTTDFVISEEPPTTDEDESS